MTNIPEHTGKKLCDNYFLNLKFQVWEHGLSCALEKIIMAEVDTFSHGYLKWSHIWGSNTVFGRMFMFFGLPEFTSPCLHWHSPKKENLNENEQFYKFAIAITSYFKFRNFHVTNWTNPFSLFMVTGIRSIRKSTQNSQKLGKGWSWQSDLAEDSRVNRKRNQVDKSKSLRKKKRKDWRI